MIVTTIQGRCHHRSWGRGHAPPHLFKFLVFYCFDPQPQPSNALIPPPSNSWRRSCHHVLPLRTISTTVRTTTTTYYDTPTFFSNVSVWPPTFQCIDPPPSKSWRRPCHHVIPRVLSPPLRATTTTYYNTPTFFKFQCFTVLTPLPSNEFTPPPSPSNSWPRPYDHVLPPRTISTNPYYHAPP